jgi:hypothetical protein
LILAFRAFVENLESNSLCVLGGSVVSDLFIRAGGILVDETVFFLAEDGLKGATATGAVGPFIFWPVGMAAV